MGHDWSMCQSLNIWWGWGFTESSNNGGEYCRKVVSGKKVAGAFRSMVNTEFAT